MTTILPKLVIDITALPCPEQAPIMYFRRSQYTVVYPFRPLPFLMRAPAACGAAILRGSRPFEAAARITIGKSVLHHPPDRPHSPS